MNAGGGHILQGVDSAKPGHRQARLLQLLFLGEFVLNDANGGRLWVDRVTGLFQQCQRAGLGKFIFQGHHVHLLRQLQQRVGVVPIPHNRIGRHPHCRTVAVAFQHHRLASDRKRRQRCHPGQLPAAHDAQPDRPGAGVFGPFFFKVTGFVHSKFLLS